MKRSKEALLARLKEWKMIEAGEPIDDDADFKSIAPRIIENLEKQLKEYEEE